MRLALGRLSIELRWPITIRWHPRLPYGQVRARAEDDDFTYVALKSQAFVFEVDEATNQPPPGHTVVDKTWGVSGDYELGALVGEDAWDVCRRILTDTSPDSQGRTTGARHDLPVEVEDGGHYRLRAR